MTMSPRKAVAVVVGLVFLAITAFAAYLSLTEVRSNDECLWGPRLWSTANGRQTTTVNITASESWEFQYVRALIWVDDARAGETSPLADGASGGDPSEGLPERASAARRPKDFRRRPARDLLNPETGGTTTVGLHYPVPRRHVRAALRDLGI